MRKQLPLILIIVLAAFLRLIALGKVPLGISPDEVSQGYSAYSLLTTGRDEWGIVWPVTSFRSFLDYKAPLQTYLMIPSIALFGLSEFSIRLPSAIFGILAVWAVYLLTTELFGKKRIGYLAAFFLAISPWAIQFSRTALEVNLSSFLFPLGLYLFLRGLKKPILFYLVASVWGINLYTYHAAKYFEPLFLIFLLFGFRKQLSKIETKTKIKASLVGLLIVAPLLLATVFGSAGERARDLLISQLNVQQTDSIAKLQYFSPLNRIFVGLPRVFSNKVVFIIKDFTENYLSYLSPSFWFTEGGREITYSVLPGIGLLHLFMLPLIVYGLYRLIKDKNPRLNLLLCWLFLAILPAALTKGGYRPNRVGALLVFWEIIAAFGLLKLGELFHLAKRRYLAPVLAMLSLAPVIFYFNTYFFEYPFKYPKALSFGYRDLVTKINGYPKDQPVIVDRGSNSQTFFAFYNQTDPKVFQEYSAIWWQDIQKSRPQYLDQLEKYRLGNITFKIFNPGTDLVEGNLVVIPSEKMSDTYKPLIVDRILYPDGDVVFYLLEQK